jgi:DNA-binding GntR family transcriptional regulator
MAAVGRGQPRAGSARRQVSRKSITDQVCEAVREMILMGELKPGEPVTQDGLADALDVSTMPVREALQRLSYEGLVDSFPGRSYRVASYGRQDLKDIYWAHAMLEAELTRRAAIRRSDSLVPALEAIQAKWTEGDLSQEDLFTLNRDFHRLINRAADSRKLLVLLRNTLSFIPQHLYLGLPAWADVSLPAHRSIIDAIAAGDGDKAAAAASEHVHEAGDLLLAHWEGLDYWKGEARD